MKNRENAVKIHLGGTGGREDYLKDDKLSLMEKLRIHYNQRQESGAAGKFATKLMYLLMAFQAPTQLYMTITYIIPVVFNEYDDWTQYCLKVVIWFLCLEGLANYFCVILYDTAFRKTKDRPNLKGLEDRWENPPDHFVPYPSCFGKRKCCSRG
ncbi:hypothetical protein KUTeg_000769 [Tegillarca granosa]|uniref:Uncharacterized protein n=1 Tax=Tegillarca granosa TaxID=220873 RepID=A0ABQ9FYH1_TEGGR|nr:hypothetical protein KUTeg_000769 [Tegillarca granosa]